MGTAANTAHGAGVPAGPLLSAGRRGVSIRTSGRTEAIDDRFDFGIVALLVIAVLLPGIVAALELPSKVELLGDLSVALMLVATAFVVWRSGRAVVLPYLVIAFAIVLAVGALISGDVPRMVVAAKNFLLLPALALLIAALGVSEERNRVAVLTTLGLVCIQFGVMVGQGIADVGVDLVVGTFGDFSGPSTGFALVAGACLALGFYARSGRPVWLLLAFVLPMASVWSAIRFLPIVLPVAGIAVAVAAWSALRDVGARRDRMRRPLAIAATALLTTVTIFAGYAIFRPSDFSLFTDAETFQVYQEDAETASVPAREAQREAVPGRKVQVETAMRLVNDGPVTLAFGQGLGSTTYAENLGIEEPADRDYVVVGYMDAGTLLVEVGWLGVALVVACAFAIGLGSIAGARRAPPGSWTLALLVAYPGILIAMGAGLIHGNPIRNIASATIFWVLTGLVLAFLLSRRQPESGSTRSSG